MMTRAMPIGPRGRKEFRVWFKDGSFVDVSGQWARHIVDGIPEKVAEVERLYTERRQ